MDRLSPAAAPCLPAAPARAAAPLRLVVRLRRLVQGVAKARAVARQRGALAELDDTMLADLGLSREEARREAQRPFWDAPVHWR